MILSKIQVNANTMKTNIFHKMKYDLKDHGRSNKATFMLERLHDLFKTFRISAQITTMTYVVMNNFFPCFIMILIEKKILL